MEEIWEIALAGLLSGGVFAAIIEAIKELVAFRQRRKAEKEDRAEAKADAAEDQKQKETEERLQKLEDKLNAVAEGVKLMLLDRIIYLGQGYIDKGEITYDERHRFHQMHDCYHNGLNGNGDAKLIVEAVNELNPKR